MSHKTDDLYAVFMDDTSVMHGHCAEKKWPDDDFPEDATPVYYGDTWRAEVAGECVECKLFVDPSES